MTFFSHYLIGRKTQYLWNSFCSLFFSIDVDIEQDYALSSVLSSVLSALYISLIFHTFEKRTKNLNIPILFLSFVDDGPFISKDKIFDKTNAILFWSYNIITLFFNQFKLTIEHGKFEVFHFSRSYKSFYPPPLSISPLGGFIIWPKNTWKYLGFIFNRKLSFC